MSIRYRNGRRSLLARRSPALASRGSPLWVPYGEKEAYSPVRRVRRAAASGLAAGQADAHEYPPAPSR